MALEEHIDDIRKGLKDGTFKDENDVCEFIVKRLLQALDWNIYDRGVVIREYPVKSEENSGRADFALFHPPSAPSIFPKILIEVKRVGRIDTSAEDQLLRYAFNKGVSVLILTDGREWHFVYTPGAGPFNERIVCTIDLEKMDSEKCAELFRKYLRYESVCKGKARQAIEAAYHNVEKHRQMKEILPKAWNELVQQARESLINIVTEKVKELCGDEPAAHQVLDFLKSLESRQASGSTITQTQRAPSNGSGVTASGSGRKPPTRLVVTMNGETVAERNGTDTYFKILERLGVDCVYKLGVKWIGTSALTERIEKLESIT